MTKPLFNESQMTWIRAMASDNPPLWPGFEKLDYQQRMNLRKQGVPIPMFRKFGAENPRWKGDAVSAQGGRKRAHALYRTLGPCERCGLDKPKRRERHHKDGNTLNNAPENISVLCCKCHSEIDGRTQKLLDLVKYSQPKSVESHKRNAAARRLKRNETL